MFIRSFFTKFANTRSTKLPGLRTFSSQPSRSSSIKFYTGVSTTAAALAYYWHAKNAAQNNSSEELPSHFNLLKSKYWLKDSNARRAAGIIPDKFYHAAMVAAEKGNPKKAYKLFMRMLLVKPQEQEGPNYEQAGNFMFTHRHKSEAIEFFVAALNTGHHPPTLLIKLSYLYLAQGKPSFAEPVLNIAIDTIPNNAFLYNQRGITYLLLAIKEKRNFYSLIKEAMKDFKKAAEFDPLNVDIKTNIQILNVLNHTLVFGNNLPLEFTAPKPTPILPSIITALANNKESTETDFITGVGIDMKGNAVPTFSTSRHTTTVTQNVVALHELYKLANPIVTSTTPRAANTTNQSSAPENEILFKRINQI